MRKALISGFIILITALALVGCEDLTGIILDLPTFTPGELTPFVITKPVFEIIERPYYFRYAGLTFDFLNQAEEVVDKVIVSFFLFDRRTMESPFMGSNRFEITRWDTVFPGESKEIIISLDGFIHIAPSEPYLIDYFYIYEIHYADGSIWQDHHGKYRVRN